MTLPLRQLAVLLAIVCLSGAAARGQQETIWTSKPVERRDDKSMSVYPLELQTDSRPAAFHAMQPETDGAIPPPGFDLPDDDAMDDAAPLDDLSEPQPPRPEVRSGRRASATQPAPAARARQPRMAPEDVTPSDEIVYEDDVDQSLAPDPIEVTPWGAEPPAPVWSSGEWFRSGIWYTNAEFLVVRRNRPRERLLIGIDVTNPDNLFFNYGATGGVEPGMRVSVGRFIGRDWQNRDHSVEMGFLGISEFRTGQEIRAQQEGGLILLLDQKQGGINNADIWFTEYSSRFHGVETDLRLRHRPEKDRLVMSPDGSWTRQYTSSYVPSLLLGLRYINLREDYSFFSRTFGETFNAEGDLVPITEAEFRGDYNIKTRNDLVGLQIGGDFINQREQWYWGVRGKGGAFINFAEQFTVATFNDLRATGPGAPGDPSIDVLPRAEEATRANEAFFAELSMMAAYHFTPNFTARASYDLMWLGGVALAPDQFTFTETSRLSLDGMIFYQGLSLGLEVVW